MNWCVAARAAVVSLSTFKLPKGVEYAVIPVNAHPDRWT